MAYSCAVEPYRAANLLAGQDLYRCLHVSPNGAPVVASNGVCVFPDQGIEKPIDADDLFVCAGGNPTEFNDPATLAWLRAQARRGLRLGSVSGGTYVLARARLLNGYRCTVHWEHLPADGGGVSQPRSHPQPVRTGPQALHRCRRHRRPRHDDRPDRRRAWPASRHRDQRMVPAHQAAQFRRAAAHVPARTLRHRPTPTILRALTAMEAAIETPAAREALAAAACVSVRQLERLFRAYLGRTIGEHYAELRLERARMLLAQTSLSVLEVSLACRFRIGGAFLAVSTKRDLAWRPSWNANAAASRRPVAATSRPSGTSPGYACAHATNAASSIRNRPGCPINCTCRVRW